MSMNRKILTKVKFFEKIAFLEKWCNDFIFELLSQAFEKSAKLAIEAITNIRTVAGLQCEARYHDMYMNLLTAPHTMTMNRSHVRGMIFGFSQAMQFFGWGIATFYGGILVDRDEIAFEDVFKVGRKYVYT